MRIALDESNHHEAYSAGQPPGKYRPEEEGAPDLLLQSIAELPEALGV
jgi:hypothetical protein